ncbi:hypothetical protein BD410DRAFT_783909 [Rickenella mellea]|uniref:Uncharacterized protein n=1 Tax=Rickenella mellea TaxID=50990 RepID=A0A4Y7QGD2_9AGAM|nr:hypothetical protein BD410DRAFT_783909 [Rickenella mellea]
MRVNEDGHRVPHRISSSPGPKVSSSEARPGQPSRSCSATTSESTKSPVMSKKRHAMRDKENQNRRLKRTSRKKSPSETVQESKIPVRTRVDRWFPLSKFISAMNGPAEDDRCYEDHSDGSSSDEDVPQTTDYPTSQWKHYITHKASPEYSSPLSPRFSVRRVSLVRHAYPHRGHSKSSLLHQKSFWNERYDQWVAWEAECDFERAYGGIDVSQLPEGLVQRHTCSLYGPPRQQPPITPSVYNSDGKAEDTELNLALFPRMGDLSALHDPYIAHVDQCFANFPIWTLSKMIWIFDAGQRSSTHLPPLSFENTQGMCSADGTSDGQVSSELVDSSFVSASSGGDVTLVDSTANLIEIMGKSDDSKHLNLSPLAHRNWEIDWYARWEVLLHQVETTQLLGRFSVVCTHDLYTFVKAQDLATAHEPPQTHFPVVEEEEDYGELVSTLLTGVSLNPYTKFAQLFDSPSHDIVSATEEESLEVLEKRLKYLPIPPSGSPCDTLCVDVSHIDKSLSVL